MLMRSRPFRRASVGLSVALGLATALPTVAAAQDYTLGIQDKLGLRVVEWQIIENQFREWNSISGEYTVQADGAISVPFAGKIDAAGRTTKQVSEAISGALKERFGLKSAPEASVEIAQYRPFFVAGAVQSPGQYPYQPGLTAQKAVAIAGGPYRGLQADSNAMIVARSNYAVYTDQRVRLMIRLARIEAAAAGRDGFEIPQQLKAEPNAIAIAAEEAAILETAKKKLDLRLQALADLKQLLLAEITSLEKKRETQSRQIDLTRKELAGVETLAVKGLVANSRLYSSGRAVADLESAGLDIETAILRARQDISKADQDVIEAQNSMTSDLAIERNRTEADLTEINYKRAMQAQMMGELLSADTADGVPLIEYAVARQGPDGTATILKVSASDPVSPGDVISVVRSDVPTR